MYINGQGMLASLMGIRLALISWLTYMKAI